MEICTRCEKKIFAPEPPPSVSFECSGSAQFLSAIPVFGSSVSHSPSSQVHTDNTQFQHMSINSKASLLRFVCAAVTETYLPVVAFLAKLLLEVTQCEAVGLHHAAIRNLLTTEKVGDHKLLRPESVKWKLILNTRTCRRKTLWVF